MSTRIVQMLPSFTELQLNLAAAELTLKRAESAVRFADVAELSEATRERLRLRRNRAERLVGSARVELAAALPRRAA